jgi:hypothetical protein
LGNFKKNDPKGISEILTLSGNLKKRTHKEHMINLVWQPQEESSQGISEKVCRATSRRDPARNI